MLFKTPGDGSKVARVQPRQEHGGNSNVSTPCSVPGQSLLLELEGSRGAPLDLQFTFLLKQKVPQGL